MVEKFCGSNGESPDFPVRTPKRRSRSSGIIAEGFPYYAGYSEEFAEDALRLLSPTGAIVLDPWNGAGTTSAMCRKLGLSSISYDLNPVMVVVAKARICGPADYRVAQTKLRKFISEFNQELKKPTDDPLTNWIGLGPASLVRYIVQRTYKIRTRAWMRDLDEISTIVTNMVEWQAILILAIFRLVKRISVGSKSSNPTWTKQPFINNLSAEIEFENLILLLRTELAELGKFVYPQASVAAADSSSNFIHCGSSSNIAAPEKSVDVILTSPPYCTRIDYAVATLLELAALGVSSEEVNSRLRTKLLGSTANSSALAVPNTSWGETCNDFLYSVLHHKSHGSKSYYYRNFCQYFHALYQSLGELSRVLKDSGVLCTVVQGSHYKEHLIDLPAIFTEMASSYGLSLIQSASFSVAQYFGNINTRSRKYRSSGRMSEAVLVFKKSY